ncbi:MAG: Rieske (2Fe-2S) protein [Actinomycetota bacterium]|jgi:nitrite reductase/ring-hydroxylating ferredoxin subunit|nr:Rieske (2Fe-2S) protein [Actinomycetota bacterium]
MAGKTEHVVGSVSDFPEGSHRVVKVGRREIGVFNVGGKLYGLPNLCPHQTGPLCEGKPPLGTLVSRKETGWKFEWVHDGEIVACPWHGLEYNVTDGQCIAYPNVSLRSYEIVVEGGEVRILL